MTRTCAVPCRPPENRTLQGRIWSPTRTQYVAYPEQQSTILFQAFRIGVLSRARVEYLERCNLIHHQPFPATSVQEQTVGSPGVEPSSQDFQSRAITVLAHYPCLEAAGTSFQVPQFQTESRRHVFTTEPPRLESNQYHWLRRPVLCPLSYGEICQWV